MDTVEALVGPRRAGKSTVLNAIIDEIDTGDEREIIIDYLEGKADLFFT